MTIKIGLNIHNALQGGDGNPRQYSAEEKRERWERIERLQSTVNLWMDDLDSARECKRRHPNQIVVHRSWRDDDGQLHKKFSAKQLYDLYARHGEGGLVLQLWNEPTGYGAQGSQDDLERIAERAAECLRLFGAAGVPLLLPNWGEGHPHEKRLNELDILFSEFKLWQNVHYWGAHEYGTYKGMLYDDPTDKADIYPWRIGRFKFIVEYAQLQHGFIPNFIISEWGKDSAHDGSPFRGWRTTGQSERSYALELINCLKAVYAAPYIKGLCVYCYGNTGRRHTEADWWSFDVSTSPEFFSVLEAESIIQIPAPQPIPSPPPPPQPIPIPPTTEKKTFVVELKLSNIAEAEALTLAGLFNDWMRITAQTLSVAKLSGVKAEVQVRQV